MVDNEFVLGFGRFRMFSSDSFDDVVADLDTLVDIALLDYAGVLDKIVSMC